MKFQRAPPATVCSSPTHSCPTNLLSFASVCLASNITDAPWPPSQQLPHCLPPWKVLLPANWWTANKSLFDQHLFQNKDPATEGSGNRGSQVDTLNNFANPKQRNIFLSSFGGSRAHQAMLLSALILLASPWYPLPATKQQTLVCHQM